MDASKRHQASAPRRRRSLFLAIAGLSLLGLSVWLVGGSLGDGRSVQRWSGSLSSPEALSRVFLKALAEKDPELARSHAMTKEEFHSFVWPKLPSREKGFPADFIWGYTIAHSTKELKRAFADHGGRRYRYLAVTFEDSEDFGDYRIHRWPLVKVRDERGRERELQLFGHILEVDDEFKFYSFNK